MTILSKFIEEIGDEAASKAFGVKLRTVQSWRRGERLPRPRQVARIVAGSGGRVGLAGIYGAAESPSGADRNRAFAQEQRVSVERGSPGPNHDDFDPDHGRIDPDIEGA